MNSINKYLISNDNEETQSNKKEFLTNDFIDSFTDIIGWFLNESITSPQSLASNNFQDKLDILKGFEGLHLNSIVDVITNLRDLIIKHRKSIPIHGYLCSFFNLKTMEFSDFHPLMPAWKNLIVHFIDLGAVSCDSEILAKFSHFIESFPQNGNEQTNELSNLKELLKSFQKTLRTRYRFLFEQLAVAAADASIPDIFEIVDRIVRGGFCCENIKNLMNLILKSYSTLPNCKFESIWNSTKELSGLILFLTANDEISHNKTNLAIRQINTREFIYSYCNSILYLMSAMNARNDLINNIREKAISLKKLINSIIITKPQEKKKLKKIFAFYSELKLKYNSLPSKKFVKNIKTLIGNVDDEDIKQLLESSFKLILSSPDYSHSFDHNDEVSQEFNECQKQLNKLAQIVKASKGEIHKISSRVIDLINTYILYISRETDSDAFFEFVTKTSLPSVELHKPLSILPDSFLNQNDPPILPHQFLIRSNNSDFSSFCQTMLEEPELPAIEDESILSVSSEIVTPPLDPLPLESQQYIIEKLFNKDENDNLSNRTVKKEFSEQINKKITSPEAYIMNRKIQNLKQDSLAIQNRINHINELTSNLYKEFAISRSPEFDKLLSIQKNLSEEVESLIAKERELNSQKQNTNFEFSHLENQVCILATRNKALIQTNKNLVESIRQRRNVQNQLESIEAKNIKNRFKGATNTILAPSNPSKSNPIPDVILSSKHTIMPRNASLGDEFGIKARIKQGQIDKQSLNKPEQIIIPEEATPPPNEGRYIPNSIKDILNPKFSVMTPEDHEIILRTSVQFTKLEEDRRQNQSLTNQIGSGSNDSASYTDNTIEPSPSDSIAVSNFAIELLREKREDLKRRVKASTDLVSHELSKKISQSNNT